MPTETPMGSNARFIIETDGQTMTVSHDPNNGDPDREIAWQAPGASDESFIWLVRSAAAFHGTSVELGEGVVET
jgi:hypothetical protein